LLSLLAEVEMPIDLADKDFEFADEVLEAQGTHSEKWKTLLTAKNLGKSCSMAFWVRLLAIRMRKKQYAQCMFE
jgi:hypothetical protein